MPKLNHKPIQYPISQIEYQIVTPRGIVAALFDKEDRALAAFAARPAEQKNWKLVSVVTHKYDVTPRQMAPLALCA